MKSMQLTLVEQSEMRPVKQGRKPNEAYRVREHLTEDELDRLLAALKANRHGHRDWLIGLLIYRMGCVSARRAIYAGTTSTWPSAPSSHD